MKWRAIAGAAVVVVVAAIGAVRLLPRLGEQRALLPLGRQAYERWARSEFHRLHPGEKPLNWRIAEVAREFHEAQPMGRFALHRNDCSDFVACVVDEALGVGARFNRDSAQHLLGDRAGIADCWYWRSGQEVQPGDIVSVRHSPWYAPDPHSISHVGILGPDGYVYDFVKLRSWSHARYGRNSFGWFVRHSLGAEQIEIHRLKAKYRYRISAVPGIASEAP